MSMATVQHPVGFIGLGDQGLPMATAIAEAGYPLHVGGRSPNDFAAAIKGGKSADDFLIRGAVPSKKATKPKRARKARK